MSEPEAKGDAHIVGIGASAGGLEALEAFFDNMPETTDFAFVVIQHLSPDYKSLMAELLAKHTTMPIFSAEDGMQVNPGHIYLIPRKKNMTIFKRRLFLTEQEHGLNLPIDIFLRSLAEDAGERGVAVILSGTGSDGTRGVRAVKEFGGLVIVQDEEDAKFDGMPRSAISTGLVDFVVPASRIPEELQAFVSGAVTIARGKDPIRLEDNTSIARMFMLIKRKTGVDLSYYKESTIYRRLERRMGINQVADVHAYIELLESSPSEIHTLFKEILIGVTKFFRDTEAFEIIRDRVIPDMLARKEAGEPIRVWVAGCSTGEEAYSIAILLTEYAEQHYLHNDIKIFATDIDRDAIEFASHGIYPESIAADASPDRLARFFVRKGEQYQIAPAIREKVIFAYHNVFKDPPFRRVDLISCRNLLIYLQSVLQKKVLSNFHFSLTAEGFLFLGSSESIGDLSRYYRTIDSKWKIFAFKGDHKPHDGAVAPPEIAWRERQTPSIAPPAETVRPQTRMPDPFYERLIEDYLPPCVIVDENRQVVHTFGSVDRFLRVPTGRMDPDVTKMARQDIAIPLGTALQSAIRENEPSGYDGIALPPEGDGAATTLRLVVRPLSQTLGGKYFVVLFEARAADASDSAGEIYRPFDLDESVKRRIADLEGELLYTKENLQATIEELETSNEELQATNEELLSSNEELQSTNEELQSVNEELITVNSEYQKKIEELSELNDDMDNLLSGTAIGTIFLDENLTIRKFTPPASTQINLIKTDVGRRFSDLSHNLYHDTLLEDVERVQTSGQPYEMEVQNRDGHWLLLKIQPYRTEQDKSAGIVLSLVDITERKAAEVALLRQHELLMRVLDTNPSAIIMLDGQGRLIYANRPGRDMLGITDDDLANARFASERFAIANESGEPLPYEQQPFEQIRTTRRAVAGLDVTVAGAEGRIGAWISGNPIYGESGEVEGAVLNFVPRVAAQP